MPVFARFWDQTVPVRVLIQIRFLISWLSISAAGIYGNSDDSNPNHVNADNNDEPHHQQHHRNNNDYIDDVYEYHQHHYDKHHCCYYHYLSYLYSYSYSIFFFFHSSSFVLILEILTSVIFNIAFDIVIKSSNFH